MIEGRDSTVIIKINAKFKNEPKYILSHFIKRQSEQKFHSKLKSGSYDNLFIL